MAALQVMLPTGTRDEAVRARVALEGCGYKTLIMGTGRAHKPGQTITEDVLVVGDDWPEALRKDVQGLLFVATSIEEMGAALNGQAGPDTPLPPLPVQPMEVFTAPSTMAPAPDIGLEDVPAGPFDDILPEELEQPLQAAEVTVEPTVEDIGTMTRRKLIAFAAKRWPKRHHWLQFTSDDLRTKIRELMAE